MIGIVGVASFTGNFGGTLSTVRADDMAALAIKKLAAQNPLIPSELIDDVILGCINQAGDAFSP